MDLKLVQKKADGNQRSSLSLSPFLSLSCFKNVVKHSCFMSWCLKFFVLLAPYVCFHIFS